MTIHIKIGEVETLRTEDWEVILDDRQTQIETIGGKVIQDFGYVPAGNNYSCSITVPADGGETISEYWLHRTPVTVRDISGKELDNMRVVIKRYGYVYRYEKEYYWAKLEFWRND